MMHLRVSVTAGAKRERMEERGERLLIAVKEPAAENRANRRVCEIVAARLKVPLTAVRIIAGHHARSKLLAISQPSGK